ASVRPAILRFDPVAEFVNQLALLTGLIRNWRDMRRSDVLILEGGLLWMAALARAGSRPQKVTVFDALAVMSQLHRHGEGMQRTSCTLGCRLRRAVWRILESWCMRLCTVTVVCGP